MTESNHPQEPINETPSHATTPASSKAENQPINAKAESHLDEAKDKQTEMNSEFAGVSPKSTRLGTVSAAESAGDIGSVVSSSDSAAAGTESKDEKWGWEEENGEGYLSGCGMPQGRRGAVSLQGGRKGD